MHNFSPRGASDDSPFAGRARGSRPGRDPRETARRFGRRASSAGSAEARPRGGANGAGGDPKTPDEEHVPRRASAGSFPLDSLGMGPCQNIGPGC